MLSYTAYVFVLVFFKFSAIGWFHLICNAQMEDCIGFPALALISNSFDFPDLTNWISKAICDFQNSFEE